MYEPDGLLVRSKVRERLYSTWCANDSLACQGRPSTDSFEENT